MQAQCNGNPLSSTAEPKTLVPSLIIHRFSPKSGKQPKSNKRTEQNNK